MNIVYLLVHKTRLAENDPPYFYIGSKLNWKGEGSYRSSSTHKLLKEGYKDDFMITPIWVSESCTHIELLEKEKEFQLAHDVLNNEKFFNRNIANSLLFKDVDYKKRAESQRRTAFKLNKDGIRLSKVWAMKGQETKRKRYTKEYLSEQGRKRMHQEHSSGNGLLVKDVVFEKSYFTQSQIGDDGLTGYQRNGIKLKETLSEIVLEEVGMTRAEYRIYYGNNSTRFELFDFCFFSKAHAKKEFGFDKGTIERLKQGWCSEKTYSKLCEWFGEDYMSEYNLKILNPGNESRIWVCGHEFRTYENLKESLNVTYWSVEQFAKTGKPNKKLKTALIERFGENIYYSYYPDS